MVKIAIVGFGKVTDYYIPALRNNDKYKIIAVCDLNGSKKNNTNGFPFYTSYSEMLEIHEEIDAVIVSTSLDSHFDVALGCIKKNKHVLLEKPAVTTENQLRELVKLAEENNVIFSVALHMSYAPDLLWFREYTKENYSYLGDIKSIYCEFSDPYIVNDELTTSALSLGGCWYDSGINALSVVTTLVKDISYKESEFENGTYKGIKDIKSLVKFDFENDFNGEITVCVDWTLNKDFKKTVLHFSENENVYELDHINHTVTRIKKGEEKEIIFSMESGLVSHYEQLFSDFYRLLNDQKVEMNFIRIHELLYKAYQLEYSMR